MNILLSFYEINKLLEVDTPNFDKYITSLLNLANRFSQATRPKTVGQISDLIREFKGSSLEDWIKWYLKRYPNSIQEATQKILLKISEFKTALDKINPEIVEEWVKDLALFKSFIGFRFQDAILKKIAEVKNLKYKLATTEDEARGIDGFVGDIPISIKPVSYKLEKHKPETIKTKIIYYKKEQNGVPSKYQVISLKQIDKSLKFSFTIFYRGLPFGSKFIK